MRKILFLLSLLFVFSHQADAATLGEMWGTQEEENKYYKMVDVPIPSTIPMKVGSFDILDDGRLAIGTRRGDVYLVKGVFDKDPQPQYHLYATGQDEIFGLTHKGKDIYITQFGELTKLVDSNNDGVADRYETLSDSWGYANYHEFAFGSKFDKHGNIYVVLGLSSSYRSEEYLRGWCVKVTPDGKTHPVCSGLRSPGGVGENSEGEMFYIESQGPWNGACSLKHLEQGGFMGHPASYDSYDYVPNMNKPTVTPKSPSRMQTERKRVKELVPYAVIFPYIKMGRSLSGFRVDKTKGKFGPFGNQIFIGDYSLSIVMRASTEKINGVWQGACYPFREGFSTGLMNLEFSPSGHLITGGFTTNSQWPVRGTKKFAMQRLHWTGLMPFEIKEINVTQEGFLINFTKKVDPVTASNPSNYKIKTYTYMYRGAYGSPEVDHTDAKISKAVISKNGLQARITVKHVEGHIHEFDLNKIKAADKKQNLLHKNAYYTVNEIPKK